MGQEISRKAGKLFKGAPALFLNYPAAKIIPFTSFIKLRFNIKKQLYSLIVLMAFVALAMGVIGLNLARICYDGLNTMYMIK